MEVLHSYTYFYKVNYVTRIISSITKYVILIRVIMIFVDTHTTQHPLGKVCDWDSHKVHSCHVPVSNFFVVFIRYVPTFLGKV